MSSTTPPLSDSLQSVGYVLFNKTTVTILCAGLAVYLLFSLGSSIFSPRQGGYDGTALLAYSRGVDIAAVVIFLAILYSTYVGLSSADQKNLLGWFLHWNHDFWNDPNSLLELTLFTVVFFVCVYLFRVPMAPEIKPVTVHIIETKIWLVFALFVIIFFFKYILQIPIIDLMYDNKIMDYFENLPSMQWGASSPSPSKSPPTTSSSTSSSSQATAASTQASAATTQAPAAQAATTQAPATQAPATQAATTQAPATFSAQAPATQAATTQAPATQAPATQAPATQAPATKPTPPVCVPPVVKKEVYNVANQVYTYEEAQEVCHAFGSDLASYDQIEDAYQNKGGEWCSMSWSADQLVLMPTQKDTWNKLQHTEEKNACGRPGINGGFIGNTNLRYGANCYGVKPSQPDGYVYQNLVDNLPTVATAPAQRPPTMDELWRATATLNAFNNNKKVWSQY